MQNLRAIILAAGKGTRLKSEIPKVLHTLCGKPMIQYVLDVCKSVGALKTYVVLGHKSQLIKNHISDQHIVVEQKKLLGTADAVKCAAKHMKGYRGNVLIVCGDAPLISKSTLKSLVRKHKKAQADCTILTTVVHNPEGYGRIIRNQEGDVVAIREDKDAFGYERDIAEINVGAYCVKAQEFFKLLKEIKINKKKKEYYLTDIVDILWTKGYKVESVEAKDPQECFGINSQEDLSEVASILRMRILKNLMQEGIAIIDPNTTYVDADVKIGKNTVLYPFTYIERNVRIGSRCKVGPFARLRSGVKIGNSVEIGNFTEIVRTKIGNRVFMKHFSYLGDSVVGSDVNIGAGTVVANFDGTQKNITRICDGAFIGSDTVLVSPVRVGKKASTGAGSVVTKGKTIPDGSVAVGVPAKIVTRRKKK